MLRGMNSCDVEGLDEDVICTGQIGKFGCELIEAIAVLWEWIIADEGTSQVSPRSECAAFCNSPIASSHQSSQPCSKLMPLRKVK